MKLKENDIKAEDRFTWAVEIMAIRSDDSILEIGCGVGLAAHAVASRLKRGRLLAIDQSPVMISKAIRRNEDYIQSKKATFVHANLVQLHQVGQFNKIFAFNVNLFWVKNNVRREAGVLKSHLKKAGALFLFYQPPSDIILEKTVRLTKKNLAQEQFSLKDVIYNKHLRSCCLIFNLERV